MSRLSSLVSISVDFDNQWLYMKIHGDEVWAQYAFNETIPENGNNYVQNY